MWRYHGLRPIPVNLCCTQCRWHKIIAPKSDLVSSDYHFEKCPECKGELSSKQLNGVLNNLIQLMSVN